VVDRKNLPDHEPLNRRARATPQNQFAEFTEKQLLYPRLRPGIQFNSSFPAATGNPIQFVIPGCDRESRAAWIPDQVGDDESLVEDDGAGEDERCRG
jgi:hypothetical protein